MKNIFSNRPLFLLLFLAVSGCTTSPHQTQNPLAQNSIAPGNIANTKEEFVDQRNPVDYKIHVDYFENQPECIGILPLEKAIKPETNNKLEITDAQVEQIRLVLYSHLAPAKFRDIELDKIDSVITKLYPEERDDYKKIAAALGCNNLLIGKITEYSRDFFVVYSQISIGADLKFIRADNEEILWEGKYVAESHATAIPLSILGVATGLYDTTTHISDKEVLRVSDDLVRHLVSTIPEPQLDQSASLEKNDISYSVIASSLNIRSGPGRKYGKTGILHNSDQIVLLDNTDSSTWIKIKTTDGREGYVHKKYVRAENTTL